MKLRTSMARLLLAAFVLIVVSSSIPPTSAALPLVIGNPDASRTVMWTFGTPENLTLQDVELVGGRALLPWQSQDVMWSSSAQFLANGSIDATVTGGANGLELLENLTNHVSDGSFNTTNEWSFSNGTTGNVTAEREAVEADARLGYNGPVANWENFDQLTNWTANSPPGTTSGISPEATDKVEGTGSMNMSFQIMSGASWVSALHSGSVNWSAWDRLVLWINAPDVDPPLSFNITATIAGVFHTTPALPLVQGWHEVVVNISPLGTSSERSAIQDLRFRINGQGVPVTQVFFDYARLGLATQVDELAMVSQSLPKPHTTLASSGSGYLSFDWSLTEDPGVVLTQAAVNLTGPGGSIEASLTGATLGEWQSFAADISASTAGVGPYNLSFRFRVVVNSTSVSHANLRIDNVYVAWPNRRNGSYQSDPIGLGAASEFLQASCPSSVPEGTSASVHLRSGNGTNPDDASWGAWDSWSGPGSHVLKVAGADHFQLRVDLSTTNSSRSPSIQSFSLETRHRVGIGTLLSDVFVASPDFLVWRSFNSSLEAVSGTTIAFSVGNGTYWSPVPPSGPVYGVQGRLFRWRAVLATDDGLRTPILTKVEVTYEFLGPIDHVRLSPTGPLDAVSGTRIEFHATVMDSGNHPIQAAVVWSTDDPTGYIQNDGTYTAGTPGPHNVTVTVAGSPISATARVTVSAPPWSLQAVLFPYGLIALLSIAGGYGAYEFWIRRAFSIDDVFLISKDGRLMLHNTRRMRADRDEDILSGMLTAIRTFARDFDREENGDLRRFAFGDKTTLIERGEHAYLAAVYAGRVPPWAERDLRRFMRDLERTFGNAFARWSGAPEDLQGLKELTERFVSRVRYRSPQRNATRTGGSL